MSGPLAPPFMIFPAAHPAASPTTSHHKIPTSIVLSPPVPSTLYFCAKLITS